MNTVLCFNLPTEPGTINSLEKTMEKRKKKGKTYSFFEVIFVIDGDWPVPPEEG